MLVKENVKIQCAKCFVSNVLQLKKTLLDWFNKKYKMQYLEVNAFVIKQYERNNPVNWKNDKRVLCNLPLRVEPTSSKIMK